MDPETRVDHADSAERSGIDALWSIAPPESFVGVVVADGALDRASALAGQLVSGVARVPGSDELVAGWQTGLGALDPDLSSGRWMFDIGVDARRGGAVLVGPTFTVLVVPVADGQRFRSWLAGEGSDDAGPEPRVDLACHETGAHVVCIAGAVPALDSASGRSALARQIGSLAGGLTGDIELLAREELWQSLRGLSGSAGAGDARATAIISPAQISVKLQVPGRLAVPVADMAGVSTGLAGRFIDFEPGGFARLELSGLWGQYKQLLASRLDDVVLVADVSAADFLTSLSGEIVARAGAGRPWTGEIVAALTDSGPVAGLIAACDQVTGLPGLTATVERPAGAGLAAAGVDSSCAWSLDTGGPASVTVRGRVWIEGEALHISFGESSAAPAGAGPLSTAARGLLTGQWTIAAWGSGTLIDGMRDIDEAAWGLLETVVEARVALWLALHIREVSIAVDLSADATRLLVELHTTWSYPDPVLTALEPLVDRLVGGDREALVEIAALADRYADTQMGADQRTGSAGLVVPTAVVGVFAGVAFPAFIRFAEGDGGDAGGTHEAEPE